LSLFALACASAASNGAGSITTSTSPVLTSFPSEKLILTIWPSTRDFTSTLLKAWTVPKPSSLTGTSPRLTVLARTGMPATAGFTAPDVRVENRPRSNPR
jgi:hypothetical protein